MTVPIMDSYHVSKWYDSIQSAFLLVCKFTKNISKVASTCKGKLKRASLLIGLCGGLFKIWNCFTFVGTLLCFLSKIFLYFSVCSHFLRRRELSVNSFPLLRQNLEWIIIINDTQYYAVTTQSRWDLSNYG